MTFPFKRIDDDILSVNADQAQEIRCEWLANGRIVAFTPGSSLRKVTDAWADQVIETIQGWPEGHPLLVLTDVTAPNLAITPRTRERVQDIVAAIPETAHGRHAVVVRNSTGGHLLRLFVNHLLTIPKLKSFQQRVFFKRAEALDWLMEALDS